MSPPVVGRVEFDGRMRSLQVSVDRIRALQGNGDVLAMRLAEWVKGAPQGAKRRRGQRALDSWRRVRGSDA